jgi:Porin subfamily
MIIEGTNRPRPVGTGGTPNGPSRGLKRILLGAGAGLLIVASAQAADLPVKAAPVEYVKVCSLYGAGFFYIPGTDTCLKVGGYLRTDHVYGSSGQGNFYLAVPQAQFNRLATDEYSFRARMNLTVDFRTQSDYGTIRAYAAIIAQQSQNDASANGSAGILRAFIQFAGFTVGHAVSYFDFINGADYGYIFPPISAGTGVNGTDLIAYTWQIGNGFSASIDLEDGGNASAGISGTGRGKVVINTSMPGALGTSSAATTITNDAARAMQPDIVGNLRLDQAWGSAQVMAALHNASGGYYSGVPGALNASLTGSQSFGHPGEAWGWAVGGGAKIANFLFPRDKIEFEADYCHGALAYCIPPIIYSNDWVYGGGNTLAMGYGTDGVFNNGGQIQLTDSARFQVGYEHYWNTQWRTAVEGGQIYTIYNNNAKSQLCGTAPGSAGVGGASSLYGSILQTSGTFGGVPLNFNCNPNWSQTVISTRTAWNPHPFLEIGYEVGWMHTHTANSGSVIELAANGARPAGVYQIKDQDGYYMALRFQKNILP